MLTTGSPKGRPRAFMSMSSDQKSIEQMSEADFLAAWRRLVGEPPAIMLDSRAAMIRLLVTSVGELPATLPRVEPRLQTETNPARGHQGSGSLV